MWHGVHEIVSGGGAQTIDVVPWRRPTAATYVIEDLLEGKTSASRYIGGTADTPSDGTIESVNVATTDDAGRGTSDPRLITAVGSTLTVQHQYAIEAADGRFELFTCHGASATTIVAAEPLSDTYPSGSTVRGIRVTGTFPADEADDEDLLEEDRPYRVTWNLTIGGELVTILQPIRLVRAKWNALHLGDLERWLRETWPDVVRAMTDRGPRPLILSSVEVVAARLRKIGIDPSGYLGGPDGLDLVRSRVILECARRGYRPKSIDDVSFMDDARREWGESWSNVSRGADPRDTAQVRRSDDTLPSAQPRQSRRLVRRA